MSTSPTRQPIVVLFTGPPGSGKTTLAEATAAQLGASTFGWDWAMAALTGYESVQAALESLERDDYRRVGWSILWNLAEAQLRAGRSVVLDGVARDSEVAETRAFGERNGALVIVVATACTDESVHRARIEGRQRNIPGWHELEWADVRIGTARWTEPTDVDHSIDTSTNPDCATLVEQILWHFEQ